MHLFESIIKVVDYCYVDKNAIKHKNENGKFYVHIRMVVMKEPLALLSTSQFLCAYKNANGEGAISFVVDFTIFV